MRRGLSLAGTLILWALLSVSTGPPAAAEGQCLHPPVENPDYIANCGVCHPAYAPELLSAESWGRILEGLDLHFGEWVELEDAPRREIGRFLENRAANRSGAEITRRLTAPAGSDRITDGADFVRRHAQVSPPPNTRRLDRPMADCTSCHPGAEQGFYDTVSPAPR